MITIGGVNELSHVNPFKLPGLRTVTIVETNQTVKKIVKIDFLIFVITLSYFVNVEIGLLCKT